MGSSQVQWPDFQLPCLYLSFYTMYIYHPISCSYMSFLPMFVTCEQTWGIYHVYSLCVMLTQFSTFPPISTDKKQGARGQITGRLAGHLEQLDQPEHWTMDGIYL